MSEEKTENRFIEFFIRNRKNFLPFKYFVYLVGIVVIILFTLDFVSKILLKYDFEKEKNTESPGIVMIANDIDNYMFYDPHLEFLFPYKETSNPCKNMSEDPFIIYTFGGSTMWGTGAKYNQTIASHISELLCKKGIPAEVKNFGVPAHVNTKEVIHLFLKLQGGEIPDITVFYDGANDINGGGYSLKTPEVFNYFTQRMNYRKGVFPNIRDYVSRRFGVSDSSLYLKDDILNDYFFKFKLRTHGFSGEELYEKVMEIYLQNIKIVKSMEESWGFKSFFYWQPTLYDKMGSLSEEEEVYLRVYPVELRRFEVAGPTVNEFLSNISYVRDLTGVFSNRSDTVFFDSCHIFPENNKIIAEKMVEDIIKYLEESDYYEEK